MHQYETVVDITTRLLESGRSVRRGEERERYENLRAYTREYLALRERELLGEPVDPSYHARHACFMRSVFEDVYDPARESDEGLDR